jgi:hypothetical protein
VGGVLMMKKKKMIIRILIWAVPIILFCLISYGIYWYIQDFLNDYRCSVMDISDFYQDPSCKKYWGLR